jgi:hypothetical protein
LTTRHIGFVNPVPWGLVQQGPLVQVTLGLHPDDFQRVVAEGGTPKSFQHALMVDTGAQATSVENKIPEALGLVPIRFARMMGVSGKPEDYPVYRMSVGIGMGDDRTGTVLPAVFVADVVGTPSPPAPLSHVGLLGRDFLRHVQLLYDGPKGRFELVDYQHVSSPPPQMPKPTIAAGWRDIQAAHKRGRKHKRRR